MLQEKADVVDGSLVPVNGYILVSPSEAKTDIIVVGDLGHRSGVVLASSDDETDDTSPTMAVADYEWKPGDLIYYIDSTEVDGQTLVHWTDVLAYRRFNGPSA